MVVGRESFPWHEFGSAVSTMQGFLPSRPAASTALTSQGSRVDIIHVSMEERACSTSPPTNLHQVPLGLPRLFRTEFLHRRVALGQTYGSPAWKTTGSMKRYGLAMTLALPEASLPPSSRNSTLFTSQVGSSVVMST